MSAIATELRRRITKDFSSSAVLALPIPNSQSFSYASPDQMMIEGSADDAEMSIDFTVITDEVDREGDVIRPQGILAYLDEYKANPVWLLEHNPVEPVGLCRDKSGRFHLEVGEHSVVAKCFYNRLCLRGHRLSEEIYLLTKAGVFAGASPGFLPTSAKKRGYGKNDGYEYTGARITELSQTTQPVNQSALRASLSRGIVKSLVLKNRLKSLLVKPNPVVRGGFAGFADGVGVLERRSMFIKSFDESKHARDHGKFTSEGGVNASKSAHRLSAVHNPSATDGGSGGHRHAKNANDASRSAVNAAQNKKHAAAQFHHESAARHHGSAVAQYHAAGNHDAADSHQAAANAHRGAAEYHSGASKGKSMKPRIAAIEFDADIFKTEASAVAWLDAHGRDSSICVPLPASFIFKQADGAPTAGKKSLARGVTALLAKAFGKKNDEDEDEKKKKDDPKDNDMPDKIEKGKDEDAEEGEPNEDADDSADDSGAETDEGEADEAEDEIDEGEPEDEEPADPAALKAEAQDLANVVTHFETLLTALPEMTDRASKIGEIYGKLQTDCDSLVKDLRSAFAEHFADQALDSMAESGASEPQTPAPASDANETDYAREATKSLKRAAGRLNKTLIRQVA